MFQYHEHYLSALKQLPKKKCATDLSVAHLVTSICQKNCINIRNIQEFDKIQTNIPSLQLEYQSNLPFLVISRTYFILPLYLLQDGQNRSDTADPE